VPSFSTYVFYFGLTLAVELPLLAIALGRRCGVGRALVAGVVASGVTHPLLTFAWPLVVPPVTRDAWVAYAASGELLVVVVEAAVIYVVALRRERASRKRTRARLVLDALIVSFAVNAASFAVGALTW
jgi:hypothetical protein